ncbi:MAG: alpha/beta fold hydrolase [Clostridiales bacterium]|nr:alpha/beta fold hydrolase [Clostridiales bacterium]
MEKQSLVICIHGIMGGPSQFDEWAALLRARGHVCRALLLPGHGVDAREFGRFGPEDWARHLQTEIEGLRGEYEKIFLVGHSMGGLLALRASLASENKIAGLFLIATPLRLRLGLWHRLRLLFYRRGHAIKAAYMAANGIGKITLSVLLRFGKPLWGLLAYMKETRLHLAEVSVPVCMVHSRNDETVAFRSAALLREGLSNTRCEAWALDGAWHAYYSEAERGFIGEKLVGFVDAGG